MYNPGRQASVIVEPAGLGKPRTSWINGACGWEDGDDGTRAFFHVHDRPASSVPKERYYCGDMPANTGAKAQEFDRLIHHVCAQEFVADAAFACSVCCALRACSLREAMEAIWRLTDNLEGPITHNGPEFARFFLVKSWALALANHLHQLSVIASLFPVGLKRSDARVCALMTEQRALQRVADICMEGLLAGSPPSPMYTRVILMQSDEWRVVSNALRGWLFDLSVSRRNSRAPSRHGAFNDGR